MLSKKHKERIKKNSCERYQNLLEQEKKQKAAIWSQTI